MLARADQSTPQDYKDVTKKNLLKNTFSVPQYRLDIHLVLESSLSAHAAPIARVGDPEKLTRRIIQAGQ